MSARMSSAGSPPAVASAPQSMPTWASGAGAAGVGGAGAAVAGADAAPTALGTAPGASGIVVDSMTLDLSELDPGFSTSTRMAVGYRFRANDGAGAGRRGLVDAAGLDRSADRPTSTAAPTARIDPPPDAIPPVFQWHWRGRRIDRPTGGSPVQFRPTLSTLSAHVGIRLEIGRSTTSVLFSCQCCVNPGGTRGLALTGPAFEAIPLPAGSVRERRPRR